MQNNLIKHALLLCLFFIVVGCADGGEHSLEKDVDTDTIAENTKESIENIQNESHELDQVLGDVEEDDGVFASVANGVDSAQNRAEAEKVIHSKLDDVDADDAQEIVLPQEAKPVAEIQTEHLQQRLEHVFALDDVDLDREGSLDSDPDLPNVFYHLMVEKSAQHEDLLSFQVCAIAESVAEKQENPGRHCANAFRLQDGSEFYFGLDSSLKNTLHYHLVDVHKTGYWTTSRYLSYLDFLQAAKRGAYALSVPLIVGSFATLSSYWLVKLPRFEHIYPTVLNIRFSGWVAIMLTFLLSGVVVEPIHEINMLRSAAMRQADIRYKEDREQSPILVAAIPPVLGASVSPEKDVSLKLSSSWRKNRELEHLSSYISIDIVEAIFKAVGDFFADYSDAASQHFPVQYCIPSAQGIVDCHDI